MSIRTVVMSDDERVGKNKEEPSGVKNPILHSHPNLILVGWERVQRTVARIEQCGCFWRFWKLKRKDS